MKKQNIRFDYPISEMMNLLTCHWKTQIIYSAVEIGIIDLLAVQPMTIDVLLSKLNTNYLHDKVRRFLCALITLDVIELKENILYITKLGLLLSESFDGSLKAYAKLSGDKFYKAWGNLSNSLKYDKKSAYEIAWGKGIYKDESLDTKLFAKAMFTFSQPIYTLLVDLIKKSNAKKIIDLGGGDGKVAIELCKKIKKLEITVYDRKEYKDQLLNIESLFTFEVGDILKLIPSGYDTYMLVRVLHNWPDEDVMTILKNIYSAMNSKQQRLYIIDTFVYNKLDNISALMDINIMVLTGGKIRSVQEYIKICKECSFELNQEIILNNNNGRILEFGPIRKMI